MPDESPETIVQESPPEEVPAEVPEPSVFDSRVAPGSRSAVPLEEKQFKMAKRGNPNLRKGEVPYCVNRQSLQNWIEDHPTYTRKTHISTDIVRRFLEERVTKGGKKLDEKGEQRLILLLRAVFKTALNPTAKQQVAAAQLLVERAYGKARAADEDLNAIKKGGLTLVYVDRREDDPEIPLVEQRTLPAAPPEFIDAEVFEDGK